MAAIYCDDETLFGPTEAQNQPENFDQLLPEDQVTMKKEIKIQKELTVKRKESDKREKKRNQAFIFQRYCVGFTQRKWQIDF